MLSKRAALIEAAGDGDARLAEGVGYLRFAEARSVIFEGQLLPRIVEAESAEAVGVREFAELAQLIVAQRGLQFISDFHECHGGIIPAGERNLDEFGCNRKSSNIAACPTHQ